MPANFPVHVIDDDEAVRWSVSFLLRGEGYPVTTYESGEAFFANCAPTAAGVMLLDLRMAGMSGMEVHRQAKELGFRMPVVVTTGHGDVSTAVQAMKAGAREFLEKPYPDDALLATIASIREECRGQPKVGSDEARHLVEGLSERERDVLGLLVEGLPNKIVAYRLGISIRTVEMHRANLMHKLKVRTLSATLSIALASGVFS